MGADSQYYARAGWCCVGRLAYPADCGIAAGSCFAGMVVLYQAAPSNSYCVATGSTGSCTDPDAVWHVNCAYVTVQCTYQCDGSCSPTPC